MAKKTSIWNDNTFNILKNMLSEEFRTREIADELSRVTGTVVTKSAVISKAHRSGLEILKPKRNKKVLPVRECVKEVTTVKESSAVFTKTILPSNDAVLHLRYSQCRWPHGDPRTAEFGFCENARINNSPYCKKHHRAAIRTKKRD